MTTLRLYTGFLARLQNGLFGGFFAAIAAGAGAYLYLLPEHAWHGPGGPAYGVAAAIMLVCGSFLGVYFLQVTVEWRPKLIIGDDGLTIPKYGRQLIKWADIASVDYSITFSTRDTFVLLKVNVLDTEFKYLSRGDRDGEDAAERGGANILYTVYIEGIALDYVKVLQLVFDHLPAGSHHPPLPSWRPPGFPF